MENFKRPLLFIFLVLMSLPVLSQNPRKQLNDAENQYKAKAYTLAIESYNKILRTNINNEEALSKIADCYWSINQMENAYKAYAELMKKGKPDPKYLRAFGDVCKALGRYEEAKRYYSDYATSDRMVGEHFAKSCDFARYQQSQQGEFTVTEERINSAASDFSPTFWGDQVVFASQRSDVRGITLSNGISPSILLVSRIGQDGLLSRPEPLSTRTGVGPVSYSGDGRSVAFTINSFTNGVRQIPYTGAELRILTAEVTAGNSWVNEQNFPYNTRTTTGYPSFTADGQAMFFASNEGKEGYGGYDIYVTYRKGNSWVKPINLGPKVNTPGDEIAPFFDGNNLFFSSDWHEGLGCMDIFRADQQNGEWVKVTNLGAPVNSPSDDYGFIFDGSKNVGYLVSNRNGSRGAEDIFRVNRGMPTAPDMPGTGLALRVINAQDGSPVAGATIDLSACNPNFTRTIVTTNAAGVYMLPNDAYTSCDIIVAKDGYNEQQVSLYGATAGGNREVEIMLSRKGEDYYGSIINGQTRVPLAGVAVSAQNLRTGAVARGYSNQQGQVALSLATNSSYQVVLAAQGFKDVVFDINTFNPQNRNILGTREMFPAGSTITGIPPENQNPGNSNIQTPPYPETAYTGFAIQISAMRGAPDMSAFSSKVGNAGKVYNVFVDNLYKIRVGPYTTRAQADQVLRTLKSRGFPQAFVTSESGSNLNPNPNLNPNLNPPAAGDYMIQLGAYRNLSSFNPGAVASMGPIIDFRRNDLTLKLLSGFRTVQEARNALPRVRSAGFPDAFVVERRNGEVKAVTGW